MRKLTSIVVVINSVERTFVFYEPVDIGIEKDMDELECGQAAYEYVKDVFETIETQFTEAGPASATVTIEYSATYNGTVEVELDLENTSVTTGVEASDYAFDSYEVREAIERDVEERVSDFELQVEEISEVLLYDESGNDYEEN